MPLVLAQLDVQGSEGPHSPDVRERLRGSALGIRQVRVLRGEQLRSPHAELPRDVDDGAEAGEGQQREAPGGMQADGEASDQLHRVPDKRVHDDVHRRDRLPEIVGEARVELPSHGIVIEGDVLGQHRPEEFHGHVAVHSRVQGRHGDALHEAEKGGGGQKHDEDLHSLVELALIVLHQCVDTIALSLGNVCVHDLRHNDAQQANSSGSEVHRARQASDKLKYRERLRNLRALVTHQNARTTRALLVSTLSLLHRKLPVAMRTDLEASVSISARLTVAALQGEVPSNLGAQFLVAARALRIAFALDVHPIQGMLVSALHVDGVSCRELHNPAAHQDELEIHHEETSDLGHGRRHGR
mmetsp:Transcript_90643/g.259219  ORF Transcript_90643/g.259219 Transcript_90643/m.259219 type:complete len:356 (+) Transcript_90643:823-1890(+)